MGNGPHTDSIRSADVAALGLCEPLGSRKENAHTVVVHYRTSIYKR